MQNVAKPAIAVGVLAALGVGFYTWGQHTGAGQSALTRPSPAVSAAAPIAAPVPEAGSPQPAASVSAPAPIVGAGAVPSARGSSSGYSTQSVTTTTTETATAPQNWQIRSAQTTETAKVIRETPGLGAPGTVIEQRTVTQTKPMHTAYTTRVVHYKHHKTDKVHVARATKHGAMFALKLPGRLAF